MHCCVSSCVPQEFQKGQKTKRARNKGPVEHDVAKLDEKAKAVRRIKAVHMTTFSTGGSIGAFKVARLAAMPKKHKGVSKDSTKEFDIEELRARLPPHFLTCTDRFLKQWRISSKACNMGITSRAWLLHGKRGAGEKLIRIAWRCYRAMMGDDEEV